MRALFRRRNEDNRPDLQVLSVYRDHGVVPRAGRDDNNNKLGDDLARYRVVRPGDLVLNKMKTWQGSLGVSDYEGIVSPAYFVAAQMGVADSRYLHHLLRSRPLIAEYAARSKGIRPAQWDLPWESFRQIVVRLPDHATQRRIADFLDAETARVDKFVGQRLRMVDLLRERRSGLVEQSIRRLAASCPMMPLKRSTRRIEVGIVVTPSAWYAHAGVTAVRGVNVRPGGFDLSDVVYLTDEGHALHDKSVLRVGDVVVVRTGQAGAAAVVPESLDGSNCIDLIIVRPGPALLPAYLEHVLNSDWTQKHIAAHSVGTIQSHFNVGAMKQLPVPVPPVELQREAVAEIDSASSRLDSIIDRMVDQVALMREHREALITAAVTGEIDVTRKAS